MIVRPFPLLPLWVPSETPATTTTTTTTPPPSIVGFDAAAKDDLGTDTLSWSHTCTGVDRLLIVALMMSGSVSVVSSMTYNGVALTQIARVTNSLQACELWHLVNPPSGTFLIDVVTNATIEGGISSSYVNVHQTVPLGTAVTASGTSTIPSVVVSSDINELVVDCVTAIISGTTPRSITVGPDQTVNDQSALIDSNNYLHGSSREPGASSVTMSWLLSASGPWAIAAVPIKPV